MKVNLDTELTGEGSQVSLFFYVCSGSESCNSS